jgi:hypothetical protein
MNSYHRRTLEAVFRDPVSPTIVWSDVESMLAHFGAEFSEGGGSRVSVVLNGHGAVFHRPHPQKEAERAMIRRVRTLITLAGLEPDDEVQGIHGIRRVRS